jgi:hypothetical protein
MQAMSYRTCAQTEIQMIQSLVLHYCILQACGLKWDGLDRASSSGLLVHVLLQQNIQFLVA